MKIKKLSFYSYRNLVDGEIDFCDDVNVFIGDNAQGKTNLLEAMWLWNDYLLPYLVLDRKKYTTIPILIQYFKGSYGSVQMGPMMACILMTILPVIILYLAAQKYIIEGVVAGAVKG